ncbi:MAG: dienelactone hydrolase family protein [Clostridia bacterium]|nr:dienelactone hydrolase family protein [Clostridia bacterium]
MSKIQKLIAGVLAFTVVFSAVSCSKNGNEVIQTDSSDNTTVTEDVKKPGILKGKSAPDEISEQEKGPEYSKQKDVITEYAPIGEPKEFYLDFADEAYLAELDRLSEQRKQEILNTNDEIDLTGKTVYYISNNGNDSKNSGTSPDSPFKSVQRTEEIVKEGDIVLFRRGDLFRGNWTAQPGVTYGAYGEGEKPKMYASKVDGTDPKKWTLYDKENNIWRYEEQMIDIGGIFFNDGEAVAYKEIPTWNIVEKKFVLREAPGVDFVLSEQLDNDLDFFCEATAVIKGVPQVGKAENVGYLYLRSDKGNPAKIYNTIEFNPRVSGISIGGDNVTIDNLCIKHAGVHGIASGTVDNLTVTNCEFGWIGGGIQYYDETSGRVTRLGNAVEIYGGCHGYTVDNCYIYQSYDAGVTHQVRGENKYYEMYDIFYTNNLLEYNTYSVEYFLSRQEAGNKSKMKNVHVKNNIMRFSGYGWGEQRPDKGSAAHIKSWCHTNAAEEFYIEDNIFDRALHRMHHTGAWNRESVPRLKNNTYIQYYGANFGIYALSYSNDVPFDHTILEKFEIGGILYEEGAKVLFALNEGQTVEIPDPTYSEYISYTNSYSYTTNDGYTLPFRMITPPDYDKSMNYPVILWLGSEYQRGNDNVKQVKNTPDMLESIYNSWISGNEPVNAIILAPQCPKSEKLVNISLSYGKNYTDSIAETKFLNAVAELLPKACEYFGGDSTDVSVVGYSTGGTAALEFAVKHPKLIKNIAAIACFANPDEMNSLAGKKVLLYHGAKDTEVGVENARELNTALKKAGADVKYTEYERETHDCWGLVFESNLARALIG